MTRGRRAGLTMLEVVVSSAILSILTLAVLATTVPMSRASAETSIALDMDRTAERTLVMLRRDLRQSGYDHDVAKFGPNLTDLTASPGPSLLTFQVRLDHDTWSTDVTWELVADAQTGSNKITRTFNGQTTDIAGQVSALNFMVPTEDQTVDVSFTLSRVNPNDGTAITRTYLDRIEMMNR